MALGDFWVVRTPGLYGLLIRLGTHSKFNHVYIEGPDGQVVEAEPGGARLASTVEYHGRLRRKSLTPLTDAQRQLIWAYALAHVGTPYGFLDIAYLALTVLGIRWKWLLRRVESDKSMICSQLVAEAGAAAGVTAWLCGEDNPELVTPADLARLT